MAVAVLWFVGALVALGAALLPARRQVLASPRRAARAALLLCVGALVVLLGIPFDAPGHSIHPAGMAEELKLALICIGIGTSVAALPFLASMWALRRVTPLGAPALGDSGSATSRTKSRP